MMKIEKRSLEGDFVRLQALGSEHKAGLKEAILDGELWRLFVTFVPSVDAIDDFIVQAEEQYQNGEGLAFAIIEKSSNRVVGSTRFMKLDLPNKKVEIGFTFISKSYQKTAVNSETKLLMLKHAFEHLQLNRVELLTDHLNHKSRQAIARLGAKEEAILRCHMVMPDGRIRDSVLFSITHYDWPGVKLNLLDKLAR